MANKKGNTGEENTGDRNSGYYNSGNYNTGNRNSGDRNSGYYNSGNYNSGDRNSGYYNSGYYNSGNYNSGIFNTNEPKMRSFNKECDYTYSQFRLKWGYRDIELPLTAWIDKEDMTDAEKEEIEGWETMGGYLKSDLTYKEAWKVAWSKATKEQKEWYRSFPNFDPEIFFEITGIDVRVDEASDKKKKQLLDKAQELKDKADELLKEAEGL